MIRLAKKEDIKNLAPIYKELYDDANIGEFWSIENVEKLLNYWLDKQPDLFFVAEEDGKAIGAVMGVKAESVRKVAIAACRGSKECAAIKGFYNGVKTCKAVKLAINGNKMCSFGCIGYGDCVAACKFDAISIGEDGLPKIDETKCTGCGMCAKACPQFILTTVATDKKVAFVRCNNKGPKGPHVMKNCSLACIKCGICEKTCTNDAIHLVNNLPVVDAEKCTGCGDCAAKCPKKVIQILG